MFSVKHFGSHLKTFLQRSECISSVVLKTFTTSQSCFIKEIISSKDGNRLTFEGKFKKPEWEPYVLKSVANSDGACSVCSSNLDIKHTDVLILIQFLRSDGCMLPRRITGLCKTQQIRIATMVEMAQRAGLMSKRKPEDTKKDRKSKKNGKNCNTYFDESTIRIPREYRTKKFNLNKLV